MGFAFLEHAENVGFLHDQKVFAVDIVTSVPDHLPNSTRSPAFTSRVTKLTLLVTGAGADGDDFALLRLLLRGYRG